jgi:hypothetical protein
MAPRSSRSRPALFTPLNADGSPNPSKDAQPAKSRKAAEPPKATTASDIHNAPSETRPTLEPTTDAISTPSKRPLPRGRAPNDPGAQRSRFQCDSLQELESIFSTYLQGSPANPERSTCEITLLATATLSPSRDPLAARTPRKTPEPEECPESVFEALSALTDPKSMLKKQRVVSKQCILAIQGVDGFRYSFHNSWKSGEDNAYRFSYYCNDSLLNKDRVANGKAGTKGRRATKPVFDCKGGVTIKFSCSRQCVDVIYKHVPCHPTYLQRAPVPRKDAKRRAEWEAENEVRVRRRVISPPFTRSSSPVASATAPAHADAAADDCIVVEGNAATEASAGAEDSGAAATTSASTNNTIAPIGTARSAAAVSSTLNTEIEPQQSRQPESALQTTETQLREQTASSLLELIRSDKDNARPHQTADAPRANDTMPIANQSLHDRYSRRLPPPMPLAKCVICAQRHLNCDGKRPDCSGCASRGWPCLYDNTWTDRSAAPSQAQSEAEAVQAVLAEHLEKVREENPKRDQQIVDLQKMFAALKDDFEKLRSELRESQDRSKQLEMQMQDRNKQLEMQMQDRSRQLETQMQDRSRQLETQMQERSAQDKAVQEKASQAASQRSLFQPRPMGVPPRLNQIYQPQEPERPMSQAFPPMIASRKHLPSATNELTVVATPRNSLYASPNQPMVPPRWAQPSSFVTYQQPRGNMWNPPHIQPQMRR